ncbi:hypothetical protein JCM5350_002635 [Sporobolomyces pararoseus]
MNEANEELCVPAEDTMTVYLNLPSWEPKLASHPASGQDIEKDGRHHLTLLAVPQLAFYHVNGEWLYSTDNQHTLVAGPRTLRSGSRESRSHYPETAGGKKFAAGELDDPVKKEEYVCQHVFFRDGSARKTELYRITFVQQKSSYQQARIGPSTDAAPSHNRNNIHYHQHGLPRSGIAPVAATNQQSDPFFPEQRPGPQKRAPPAPPGRTSPQEDKFPPRIRIQDLIE